MIEKIDSNICIILGILVVLFGFHSFLRSLEPESRVESPVVDGLLLTEEQLRVMYPGMNAD